MITKCYTSDIKITRVNSRRVFPCLLKVSFNRSKITYLPSVSEYAVSSSIVKVDVNLDNIIKLNNLTNYIPQDVIDQISTSIFTEKEFKYFTSHILITDHFVKDKYGNTVPALYKHTFEHSNVTNVKIKNANGEEYPIDMYVYDNKYVYHNFKSTDLDIYFIEYESYGKIYLKLLNSEPVFTLVTDRDKKIDGTYDTRNKIYTYELLQDGTVNIKILYNQFLNFDFIKRPYIVVPIDYGKINTKMNISNVGWHVDIESNVFVYNNLFYYPVEYDTDTRSFQPYKPFKIVDNEEAKILSSNIIKVNNNIVYDPSEYLNIDITVLDKNNNIKLLITSNLNKKEYITESGTKNYIYTIKSASNNGYILLETELDPSDTVLVTYFTYDPYYTYRHIDFNMFINEDFINKKVFLFIEPMTYDEYENKIKTSTIRYAIVNQDNHIVDTNIESEFTLQFIDVDTYDIPFVINDSAQFKLKALDEKPDELVVDYSQPSWYGYYKVGDYIYAKDDNKVYQLKEVYEIYLDYPCKFLKWEEVPVSTYTHSDFIGMNIFNFIYNFTLTQGYVFDKLKTSPQLRWINNTADKPLLTLCEVYTNDKTDKSSYSFIDARVRGGGVKKDKIFILDAIYPGIKNLYDIGLYDGVPVELDKTILVDIDSRHIDTDIEKIKDILKGVDEKTLDAGSEFKIDEIEE